jgi:dipeptidyl aminopeptidase/acylaminoacyl peptidase
LLPLSRRALLPLILLVAMLCGCAPSFVRRPWTLAYQDDGQRLPAMVAQTGPFFYRTLQPEGAAASPTGTHVLMATQEGELWAYGVLGHGRDQRQLAESGVRAQFWPDVSPWSPDGRAFVYVQQGNLFYQRLRGRPRQLTTTADVFTAAISPDGKQVAFGRKDAKDQDLGLWVIPVSGGEPRQLVPPTNDIFHACCPHWSPDGKWIAFLQAFEGGALGVVSADGSDVRLGLQAAWEPVRWTPDSQTILFAQVVYGESADGVQSYNVAAKQTTIVAAHQRHAIFDMGPRGDRLLLASWQENTKGAATKGDVQIVDLTTLVPEGSPVPLPGKAGSCHWAPDGKQMAVLVDDAKGQSTVYYAKTGLADLKPAAPSSCIIGWVRQWQPPWWQRLWRR